MLEMRPGLDSSPFSNITKKQKKKNIKFITKISFERRARRRTLNDIERRRFEFVGTIVDPCEWRFWVEEKFVETFGELKWVVRERERARETRKLSAAYTSSGANWLNLFVGDVTSAALSFSSLMLFSSSRAFAWASRARMRFSCFTITAFSLRISSWIAFKSAAWKKILKMKKKI